MSVKSVIAPKIKIKIKIINAIKYNQNTIKIHNSKSNDIPLLKGLGKNIEVIFKKKMFEELRNRCQINVEDFKIVTYHHISLCNYY